MARRAARRAEGKRLHHHRDERRDGHLDVARVELEEEHHDQRTFGEHLEGLSRAREHARGRLLRARLRWVGYRRDAVSEAWHRGDRGWRGSRGSRRRRYRRRIPLRRRLRCRLR